MFSLLLTQARIYEELIHTRKNGCNPHLLGYYSNSNYREKMVLVFPSKYLVLVARFQSTHFASGLRVMHQSKALRNMST